MSNNGVQYNLPQRGSHQGSSHQGNGGDPITHLPVDKSIPTPNEIHLVNSLFNEPNKSTMNMIIHEGKDSILIGILFIIFSLQQIDEMIKKIIPSTANSMYIMLGVKAIMIMAVWWVIKHFYLSRKS